MSALNAIAAIVRACPVDWVDHRYGLDAEPSDIADRLYAAVCAEVLREAAAELRDQARGHISRAIFTDGIRHGAGLLDEWAGPAAQGEKSSHAADATPQTAADRERLALLRAAVRDWDGEWTTRRVQHAYTATYGASDWRSTARRDLQTLTREGLLVMHEERGRRFFTFNARIGGPR